MNDLQLLREELTQILRESPLPPLEDPVDPGVQQALAEAKALLQVMQPHGSQVDTIEGRTIGAVLDRVSRATELLAKRNAKL
ncbi:hypothetical protein [Pseudoxanthomonas sp. X-1]|uniref:hypothetical protein n=1 Tax=Pseudoxanthomonas sp. X-1 TaxID=2571115 RepID=UPI00110B0CAD|nr:hypothetical protein [Pseudoxanthomonas sp. X-1]TMN24528.1 hypothetical protein FF950_05470 [Pseudoxanthomonas sp. X-1]UAY75202.1 hypothetical protein LAJ50_02755 [Pseudoxanthomonas sp. X-1]